MPKALPEGQYSARGRRPETFYRGVDDGRNPGSRTYSARESARPEPRNETSTPEAPSDEDADREPEDRFLAS